MDKGTIARTIALVIALTNQFLVIFGRSPLPIDSELLENTVSAIFTIVTSLIAWFKNNYVTSIGMKQKQLIKENGLTSASKRKKKS
ncbi:MAG: phage holin [Bacillota bacterium]|uniref:Phage holin n=1 Tax=Virgibacillus salarius TaxID=447199 RepID=A0A941DZX9_9BACI|nr:MULTISPECIES: phage holin [Virgibacillus]NAZ09127.1 phage holin [Agaribacter marinus]MBR7796418.1 phage holin [Virgibacillus salarius]MCC2252053.1 phage holin [Virgibacillus sp. AGTR]MDY7046447.1 phage holin [Virgibacillus sp. M23]QRZ16767.1 phage holin [Virgibacillus sp. AGTR]